MSDDKTPNPIGVFKFSSAVGADTLKDLEQRRDAIADRIDNLDRKTAADTDHSPDTRLLKYICNMVKDPKDLVPLGKALVRVAELVPQLRELDDKIIVTKLLTSDPAWVASVFGDFESDVPDVDMFLSELED